MGNIAMFWMIRLKPFQLPITVACALDNSKGIAK